MTWIPSVSSPVWRLRRCWRRTDGFWRERRRGKPKLYSPGSEEEDIVGRSTREEWDKAIAWL